MILVDVQGEKELKKLGIVLSAYLEVNKRERQSLIRKKGIDAGIKLHKGFKRQRWKGGKSVAVREMRRRAKAGKGTKVRDRALSLNAPNRSKKGRKLNWWQKLVWQETFRRQSGIGVLGVSFLMRRYRKGILQGNPGARITKANRSRKNGIISTIQVSKDRFEITGFFPGTHTVSVRYGILSTAVREVTVDSLQYVKKKTGDQFESYMRRKGFYV